MRGRRKRKLEGEEWELNRQDEERPVPARPDCRDVSSSRAWRPEVLARLVSCSERADFSLCPLRTRQKEGGADALGCLIQVPHPIGAGTAPTSSWPPKGPAS